MNPPLKAIIVDDEEPAREWLRTLLEGHEGLQLAGEANSIPTAASLAEAIRPDVIFLDIQMPPVSGFDLLPQLKAPAKIIFITAHDTYAVRAFEANALDYLLKPVHPRRFAAALDRLPLTPSKQPCPATPSLPTRLQPDDLIPLWDRGCLEMVIAKEIAALEAEGAYTRILHPRFPPRLILRSLGEWSAQLPSPPFVRLDRSWIINLTQVESLTGTTRNGSILHLRDISHAIPLGRPATQRLRHHLRYPTEHPSRH